jgi:glycosyltransferase involved in cell wall biosynthesis
VIRQEVYVYDKRLQGTTSRLAPDRIVAVSTPATSGPLVSCLMVTRGDLARVRLSIGTFKRQSYGNTELVIVCDAVTAGLRRLIEESGANVRLIEIGERLSLGGLRNISIEQARGEIVCQWDDDDIYGAHRIERGVGALLQAKADAVFLRQWCIWSPGQRLLKLSRSRLWEGSMLAFRQALPRYPDIRSAEDTALVEEMNAHRVIALMDDPLSYCYCIHGQNTYGGPHFQQMITGARLELRYGEALAALSAFFAFAEHPAMSEADLALRDRHAGDLGQLRRLETYVATNQLFRRLRHRFGGWSA